MNFEKKYKLIDCCIDINSDYNISRAIHYILYNKYRYNGKINKWECFDNTKQTWQIDQNSQLLKKDIEFKVCDEFLKRIDYWNDILKNNSNNVDLNNNCSVKINKLLKCSNKLKNKNYIITIIKEARSLFEYEDK